MTLRHTILDPETWEQLRKLPLLGATDASRKDRPAVKLFDSVGQAFWVLWEYDPEERLAFGLADLGLGFPELGYVSLNEVAELGPRIERDVSVKLLTEGYASRGMTPPDYLVTP